MQIVISHNFVKLKFVSDKKVVIHENELISNELTKSHNFVSDFASRMTEMRLVWNMNEWKINIWLISDEINFCIWMSNIQPTD
jgi:hypothetical protein